MTFPVTSLPVKPILYSALLALFLLPAGAATVSDDPDVALAQGEGLIGAVEAVEADDATETEGAEAEVEGLPILEAAGVDPDEFLWDRRIVAVLANTPNDPAFVQQMRDIEARAADLHERDVVVLFDADRASGSPLRQRLRPRGFMLAIIEKDGEVKQRRPAPRDVREINATIDKFPLRRQEMLDRMPGR